MGDPIENQKTKIKGRMKKICCCGFWWTFIGIILFVVAIALLASFAQFWNDSKDNRRGLAYTGVVLLLISIIMAVIGIIFCFVLYMFYKRLSGDHSGKPHFKPQQYAYGQAPYPQQPPSSNAYSQVSGTGTTVVPSAPSANEKPSNPGDIHVEVSERSKF